MAVFIREHGNKEVWFPNPYHQKTRGHKLCSQAGCQAFLLDPFHGSPKGELSWVDDVGHADCVRIPILPPKNFLRLDETLKFSYPPGPLVGTQ
jgi:hypothetical protein